MWLSGLKIESFYYCYYYWTHSSDYQIKWIQTLILTPQDDLSREIIRRNWKIRQEEIKRRHLSWSTRRSLEIEDTHFSLCENAANFKIQISDESVVTNDPLSPLIWKTTKRYRELWKDEESWEITLARRAAKIRMTYQSLCDFRLSLVFFFDHSTCVCWGSLVLDCKKLKSQVALM